MIELTKPEVDELLALLDYVIEEAWTKYSFSAKRADPEWNMDEAQGTLNAIRQEVFAEYLERSEHPLLKL